RTSAPDNGAVHGECPDAVDRLDIQDAVLRIVQRLRHANRAGQAGFGSSRRLPHAALGVGLRVETGYKTAGREISYAVFLLRIGSIDPRKIKSRVDRVLPRETFRTVFLQRIERDGLVAVGDQESATVSTDLLQGTQRRGVGLAGYAQQIEQIHVSQQRN